MFSLIKFPKDNEKIRYTEFAYYFDSVGLPWSIPKEDEKHRRSSGGVEEF